MVMPNRAVDYPSTTSQYNGGTPVGSIILQDTASAPPVVTAFETIYPSVPQASAPAAPQPHGMKFSLKIGLSLVPIIVILIGIYIFALFWYRRRHPRRNGTRDAEVPILPEKRSMSSLSSCEPYQENDQVHHEAQAGGTAHTVPNINRSQSAGVNSYTSAQTGTIHIKMAAARFNSAASIESPIDSPIDRNNPFRLKRGNTVKSDNISSELEMQWPTPPSTTWSKRSTVETPVSLLSKMTLNGSTSTRN